MLDKLSRRKERVGPLYVLWDEAPHVLSIQMFVVDERVRVNVVGSFDGTSSTGKNLKNEKMSQFFTKRTTIICLRARDDEKRSRNMKKNSQTAHRKLPLVDERIIGKNYCSAFHEQQKSSSRYRQRLCNLQRSVLFSEERKRHWNYVIMCFNVTPVGRLCCEHDAQQNRKFCGFQSPSRVLRQWWKASMFKQQNFLSFIFFGLGQIRAVNHISINLHHCLPLFIDTFNKLSPGLFLSTAAKNFFYRKTLNFIVQLHSSGSGELELLFPLLQLQAIAEIKELFQNYDAAGVWEKRARWNLI